MSETMSGPTDWAQFYQQNLSVQEAPNRGRVVPSESVFGDQGSDATVVTTTITSSSAPSPLGSGPAGSSAGHLSPEGRVAKPLRRRSRASRRTPTTLLNTDTTNFRAMVQQFTGGPSAPFPGHSGGPNFGFGFGVRQPHVNPGSLMIPPGGFHLQYQQQQQPQQQHQFQQQNQPYMFSLSSNNPGAGDLFLQRLGGNPRPNMEGSDGFVVEGASSQVPPSRTPSSNENRSNATFMF
ncbi:VQ motif-containing protein 22-like [Herrania umbratica]|uniref:VQ motif-containing protein 22-like n=1 Tax=Herrania umbratica TaxID=108875 RepID=A0A6J0ZHR7_9ROSI|nr:VQ motif-containing protein 22-like [Herrania umbratica]